MSHRWAGVLSGRRATWAVLAFWLVLLAAVAPLSVRLGDVQNNDTLDALPASAEASRAAARAQAAFPEPDALVAVVVYARDGGLTPADLAKVNADWAAFARYAPGGAVAPATPAADGAALLLSFPLAGDDDAQSAASWKIKDQLATGTPAGLRTALTGSAGAQDDVFDALAGMNTALLLATAVVVALLLLITYRSPLLWLVPLVVVAVADTLASAAVYLLARYAGLTVDFQSQSILTVLVFGIGVDYALLLIARYREELRRHEDRYAAMRRALARSFPAILASASTVAAALLCLLAARLPTTRGLGPVAAVGVFATFAAMATLLPAVLLLAGRWLFWPFVPRYAGGATDPDTTADHRTWHRLATGVGRAPRVIWIGTAVVLATLALGGTQLSIGLPTDEAFTTEVGSITGSRMIKEHYAGGLAAPTVIYATAGSGDRVAAAARAVPGVAEVPAPERSADGQWVRVETVLADTPDSRAALATAQRLRLAVHAVPGAAALVGGDTAALVDRQHTVSRDNKVVIPLILAVVLVVLLVLLRALVAPLLLLGSVVLSYGAALGAAGLILSAMGHPRLWEAEPLQAFLFLVALGVDYTIFLMTRAREEVATVGHRTGVLRALTVTGGVITSAGVVLAATFSMLGMLPLVPSVQMGVIVAAGILLDTFLVRSLLIPALTLDLGARTWWPGRLARRSKPTPAPRMPAGVHQ
jgi:RND superfamily putative drug exporter